MQKIFSGSRQLLSLFLGITIVGIVIRYWLGSGSFWWDMWSSIDVSFAVSLGVLAFFAYQNMIKDEDEIALYFQLADEPTKTPIAIGINLLRKNCTRQELFGILGMITKNNRERFNYNTKLLKPLLDEIAKVQTQKSKREFIIPISSDDYDTYFADELSALTID